MVDRVSTFATLDATGNVPLAQLGNSPGAVTDIIDLPTAELVTTKVISPDGAGGLQWVAGGSGAPTTADYLVGTANGSLSAEIVVGTSPGGELGGTWASPTVDATHSGSSHAATQAAAVLAAWPVGSVFISVVSTDPNTLLGGGTWSAFGTGRVLVGLDAGDPDFDTVEETGGAKTVTSTGSVAAPVFTGSALGTHSHGVGTYATGNESAHTHSVTSNVTVADHSAHTHSLSAHTHTYGTIAHVHSVQVQGGTTASTSGTHIMTSTATGGSSRAATSPDGANSTGSATSPTGAPNSDTTGNPAATITHTPTNNAVTSAAGSAHNHSTSGTSEAVSAGTPSGTNNAPAYTGNATSVVQPYIVVYMWRRDA